MKSFIQVFLLTLFAGSQVYAQTNTFPSSGNVGVGTINPLSKLHVQEGNVLVDGVTNPGQISIKGSGDGYQFANLAFTNNHNNTAWLLSHRQDVANSFQIYCFDNNGWKPYQTILSNGNTGIGTSSPTSKLEIAGFVNANGYTIKENWDNVYQSVDNGNIHHLVGTYRGWDPKAVFIAGINASNNAGTGYSTTTEKVFIGNPHLNDKYLAVNLLNGRVGIGTNNTGDANYRLFVETGIRTRKVRVDQGTWADHVFSPSYRLPSLQEVEAFIKQHSHLPGMPSERDVTQKGIDLGETQKLLLQKVEELTLYVIEQQKEIDRLKAAHCK